MSHDTMAREATIKHRSSELDLAEQHYLAAIAALTPPEPQKLDDIPECSPTSTTSEDEHSRVRRVSDAASLNSEQSVASSATSFADEEHDASDCEPTPKRSNYFKASPPSRHILDDFSMSPKVTKRRPPPIITSAPRSAHAQPKQQQLSADLSAFVSMVQMHLASVRELKETSTLPSTRFSFSRSRSSTMSSRPASRNSSNLDESEMSRLRWTRKSINFRPRFDPASVRQLCNEALSEL